MATEVVLFEKLGKNEVVEAIDFGTNQQKKLRRSERPTLPGCKESRRNAFPSRANPYWRYSLQQIYNSSYFITLSFFIP
ncbi:MAG: hypothetical protein LBO71_03595 [Prevotellaceae bacterium]|jgi:hypothetical protein|nr:hypothetical protein [Prevotellaceae bacterium]